MTSLDQLCGIMILVYNSKKKIMFFSLFFLLQKEWKRKERWSSSSVHGEDIWKILPLNFYFRILKFQNTFWFFKTTYLDRCCAFVASPQTLCFFLFVSFVLFLLIFSYHPNYFYLFISCLITYFESPSTLCV